MSSLLRDLFILPSLETLFKEFFFPPRSPFQLPLGTAVLGIDEADQ